MFSFFWKYIELRHQPLFVHEHSKDTAEVPIAIGASAVWLYVYVPVATTAHVKNVCQQARYYALLLYKPFNHQLAAVG